MSLEHFIQEFYQSLAAANVVSVFIAALAGIISTGVCPCTLPVGLGVAGLVSVSGSSEQKSNRGFRVAISFFLGIVVTVAALGAMAGRVGILLSESFGQYWTLAMALLSAVAAAVAFYGPRLKVSKLAAMRRPGISGSFAYGLIFSLGTSAAPLLLLLSVAATTANPVYGFMLALAFGIGRGLPFLVVSLFAGAVTKFARLTWLRKGIQIASGMALLFVSYYYTRTFIDFM